MSETGPVFDRLALNDGALTYDDGQASFATFSVSDAGPGVGRALANLINGTGGFDDIPLASQTFSSATLDTLVVNTQGDETTGPGELVIARAEAGAFDGVRLDRFTLTDLGYDAVEPTGGRTVLDIGEIAAEGVSAALFDPAAAGDMAANPLIGGASAGFDQYDRVAVRGLRVVSGGARVRMPEFTAAIEERGGVLVSTAAMASMTVDADPDGESAAAFSEALAQLGYDAMAFSFASETEYDPEADRVTTAGENFLAMEDGFMMRFEQDVSGVEAYASAYQAWLETTETAEAGPPADVLAPLMIHSGEIRLEDRSLLDRALSLMAERQGSTPAELRAQAGLFVALGAAMAGEALPPALVSELSGALTRFIGEGGSLVVAFEPDAPVSAARFAEPGGPDLDGLTVRHEPAD
jgi:hypothetical protein